MSYSEETLTVIVNLQKYVSENRGFGLLTEAVYDNKISEEEADVLVEELKQDVLQKDILDPIVNEWDIIIDGSGWFSFDDDYTGDSLESYLRDELKLDDQETVDWCHRFRMVFDQMFEELTAKVNDRISK